MRHARGDTLPISSPRACVTAGLGTSRAASAPALSLCALLCLALPAAAQDNCGARERVIGKLAGEYGEAPQSAGIDTAGALVELWANPQTRTWTLLLTTGAQTCILGDGESWVAAPPTVRGEKL